MYKVSITEKIVTDGSVTSSKSYEIKCDTYIDAMNHSVGWAALRKLPIVCFYGASGNDGDKSARIDCEYDNDGSTYRTQMIIDTCADFAD